MIVLILSLIDMLAGILILHPFLPTTFLFYLAFFCLIKGILSLPSILQADFLIFLFGLIDVLAAISLFLTFFNIQSLKLIGWLILGKGVYSFFTSLRL